jgi:hypothetical protein
MSQDRLFIGNAEKIVAIHSEARWMITSSPSALAISMLSLGHSDPLSKREVEAHEWILDVESLSIPIERKDVLF